MEENEKAEREKKTGRERKRKRKTERTGNEKRCTKRDWERGMRISSGMYCRRRRKEKRREKEGRQKERREIEKKEGKVGPLILHSEFKGSNSPGFTSFFFIHIFLSILSLFIHPHSLFIHPFSLYIHPFSLHSSSLSPW